MCAPLIFFCASERLSLEGWATETRTECPGRKLPGLRVPLLGIVLYDFLPSFAQNLELGPDARCDRSRVGGLAVSDKNDIGRAEALAGDALTWMAQRGVPPTAKNFEVVLAYLGGEHAELKSTIDSLASRGCKFDP